MFLWMPLVIRETSRAWGREKGVLGHWLVLGVLRRVGERLGNWNSADVPSGSCIQIKVKLSCHQLVAMQTAKERAE